MSEKKQPAVSAQVDQTEGCQLQKGDKFTIEGWGKSARGHQVCNGRSLKTGRHMKVKTLQVFVVTKTVS